MGEQTSDATRCTVHVLHLPFSPDEETSAFRGRVKHGDEDPTPEEVDRFYDYAGSDEIEADDSMAMLNAVWDGWNAGSGRECPAFARRTCDDCDETFTGEQSDGRVDLRARQNAADAHERETRLSGDAHTVGRGTRSLSSGDIVVLGDTAFFCEPIGWTELDFTPEMEVDA